MTESCFLPTNEPATQIVNVAAYKFVALDKLPERRKELIHLCHDLELKGTVMLSPEGINLFIAGTRPQVTAFLAELRRDQCFDDLSVKESLNDHQPFNRMLVKIKREIIAFGVDSIRPAERTSPKLSARELRLWLDEGRPVTLLDVRNDYEIALGTFRGAVDLKIKHFRDFPTLVEQLPAHVKQRPTVMFCTGGIRCEKAGPFMEQHGFEQIYQLDGGILKYFEECGGDHYDGDCFVFDKRVAVDSTLEPTGAALCFSCLHVLTLDDQQSELYSPPNHCPFCYRSPEQMTADNIANRQRRLQLFARSLPGCIPYENRRDIHVSRKCVGMCLIDFLDQWHPGYSRLAWQAAIDRHEIFFDSVPVDANTVVREGQCFTHVIPDTVEPPVNPDIKIVYEDSAIVVVDKPAPLPSHACGRFNRNTLAYFLGKIYYPEKLRIAHRLDANTTGLILFSRRHSIAKCVQTQFSDRTVEKRYLARVPGHPRWDHLDCHLPITSEPAKFGSRTTDGEGLEATTEFMVVSRFSDGTTLIEARPTTGRTNQIRVHLWQLGFPICHDPLYKTDNQMGDLQTLDPRSTSMQLHSWQISIDHPITQKRIAFQTDRPLWAIEPSELV